jgi:hypothetical protein
MGRKWTQDDVLAYKIKVVHQDLRTFFGITNLPAPDVENDALTAQDRATATDRRTCGMLWHMNDVDHVDDMDRAMGTHNREPATTDFVTVLFDVIRYPTVARSVMMRHRLRYLAGRGMYPQVDVCILDDTRSVLLVVKVDSHLRGSDPEPRLISAAIAAFHNDNIGRVEHLGADPLTSKVMPGMVMDGTMPTFYKIPITPELVTAVESGEQPDQETVVHVYRPEVPRPEEGMRPLDNRSIIFSCFEAFRKFL